MLEAALSPFHQNNQEMQPHIDWKPKRVFPYPSTKPYNLGLLCSVCRNPSQNKTSQDKQESPGCTKKQEGH